MRQPLRSAVPLVVSLLVALAAAVVPTGAANAADVGSIHGTVTGPDGTGLVGVQVVAYSGDGWAPAGSVVTSGSGAYEIAGLAPGTYRLGFFSGGLHPTEFWADAPTLGSATDIEMVAGEPTATHDAQLDVGGGIAGQVGGTLGSDVSEVVVSAFTWTGTTWERVRSSELGDDRTYLIAGLVEGTYRVEFEDGAGVLETEYWNNYGYIEQADDIDVVDGDVVPGVNAIMSTPAVTGVYKATSLPTITGTAQVGSTLKASPGTWTPAGASFGYEWRADNFTQGRGEELLVTEEMVGKIITLHVTATGTEANEGFALATPTAKVVPAPGTGTPTTPVTEPPATTTPVVTTPAAPALVIKNLTLPKISGKARVGRTLKVGKGTWSSSSVRLRYQWLANGKAITKATRAKLVLTRKLKGKKISVRVTASLAGTPSVTVRTKPTARVAA